MTRILAVCALLTADVAFGWPVDVYVDLRAGEESFQRLAAVAWVEVEDPEIATAEVLPSGELLLTGKRPGRTLLLLYAEGKFAVWRLRVDGKSVDADDTARALVGTKCPGAKLESTLTATVKDEACRQALKALLETDTWRARDLELTFEVPALQAQLADIQAGLPALKARYVGAGVIVEGEVSSDDHRKALWTLFRRSVGRVPLEDRMTITPAE